MTTAGEEALLRLLHAVDRVRDAAGRNELARQVTIDNWLRPIVHGEAWPGTGSLTPLIKAIEGWSPDQQAVADEMMNLYYEDGMGLGLAAWRPGPVPGWLQAVKAYRPQFDQEAHARSSLWQPIAEQMEADMRRRADRRPWWRKLVDTLSRAGEPRRRSGV